MNRKSDLLVFLGAAVGGALGYFLFFLIARQGFYGLVLPGGLLGFGAGLFRSRSKIISVVCGLSALALGFLTEWRYAHFIADASFGYFMLHVHQLNVVTLLMIGVGAAIGFWIPFRRSREVKET